MADEQEVPDTDSAVGDGQDTGSDVQAQIAAEVEKVKRSLQSDYTRKMQELADDRDNLRKEREALDATKQKADLEDDPEAEFARLGDDPLAKPSRKLAAQLKLTRSALDVERTAKKALEERVSRIEELALDREFDSQFADATNSYAADITLDREHVRQFIRDNKLDAKPASMVKRAILLLAGDELLAKKSTGTADKAPSRGLPKSAPKSVAKGEEPSPLEAALAEAKRLFGKK